jgi:hypothetical protein
MAMLQLIQQASAELGLAVPSSVAGNQTQDVVQMLALLNAAGYELMSVYPWEALNSEYRFYTQFSQQTGTTVNGSAVITGLSDTSAFNTQWIVTGLGVQQDCYIVTVDSPTQVTVNQPLNASGTATLTFSQMKYAMPADFLRITDRTQWDKSKHWEMLGPETPQQWQWLKSGYISTGPRMRWRQQGGFFQVWPPMGTNEYLGFEYISSYWARSSTGVPQAAFLLDTDTSIYPDRLLVLALKLKYFETKGFETTALYRDYNTQLEIAKSADGGAANLSFAPRISTVLIGWVNIPDSGYGS